MIKRSTVTSQVYEHIRRMILTGEIDRDVLYSEQWFADNLKISRTPVREALAQLKCENLIEIFPNRGAKIKEITIKEAEEILEIRKALEGYCVAYMATKIEDPKVIDCIVKLKNIAEKEKGLSEYSQGEKSAALLGPQVAFHKYIIDILGNEKMNIIFANLCTRIDMLTVKGLRNERRIGDMIQEHQKIIEAIQSQDPAIARLACEQHIDLVLEQIISQTKSK